MYLSTQAFLLIFYFSKEITSTSSQTQCSPTKDQYDITSTLNNSIVQLLQRSIDLRMVKNLIDEMKYHRSTYEMENTPKQEPFQDKIFFHDIEIRSVTTDKFKGSDKKDTKPPSIFYNFTRNELGLWNRKLSFKIYGYIGTEPKKANAWFRASLEYKQAKMNIRRREEKFLTDIKGDVVENRFRLQQWDYDYTNISSPYTMLEELIKGIEPSSRVHIAENVRATLINKTKPLIPSLLLDNINHNKKLMNFLNATFHHLPNQNEIISTHPDLLDNEEQYYFSVPNFSLLGFNLSNIKIQGLWNYNLLQVQPTSDVENANYTSASNTLWLKNIKGSMNWDHGLQDVAPVRMNFSADQLSITFDERSKSISVRTLKYRVTEVSLRIRLTKLLYLSKISQCTELHFEAAVGSSIMPSIQNEISNKLKSDVPNIYEETLKWYETLTEAHQQSSRTTQQKDISSPSLSKQALAQALKKLHRTTIKQAEVNSLSTPVEEKSVDSEEKTQIPEPYNYHISFPNITIKLLSTNPQATKQIQCELFNNSQFTRHIDAMLAGALYLNSSNGKSLPFNFHCDFKGVKFSIIRPDSLDKNGTCEFQLNPNQDIDVELSPSKNSTVTEDELNMKRKIDAALITMATMKQRILNNMKSIACFPLDVCTQSAKLIDDFVLRFVDNLLKKCSLRNNEITITS